MAANETENQSTLKAYLRRLSNLSANNPSLLLLRLTAAAVDWKETDFLNRQSAIDLLKNVIERKKNITLCEIADARRTDTNLLSQRLKSIFRKSNEIEEERGTKDLYIGYPIIEGRLQDDTPIRCPLLYIPVALKLEQHHWKINFRTGEEITFNKNFWLAYTLFNQVQLPEELIEYSFEATTWIELLPEIYEKVGKHIPYIKATSALFEQQLKPFENYKKADFQGLTEGKTGQLQLHNQAVLGIFPQSDSYLAPDYAQLIEQKASLTQIFDKKKETLPFQNIQESDIITPFALDASQEKVLHEVKKGGSLVVQGPPGTGKSQLICHLVADAIAQGKSVLVVCQKRIALDVVYQRLQEKKLHPHSALVHDVKADRQAIFDKIAAQVHAVESYQTANNQLDTVYLEREFLSICKEIDKTTQLLEQLRTALFDEKLAGISIKFLYLQAKPHLPTIAVSDILSQLKMNDLIEKKAVLLRYFKHYENVKHETIARRSFANFDFEELKKIQKYLAQFSTILAKLKNSWKHLNLPQQDIFYLRNFLKKHLEKLESTIVEIEFFEEQKYQRIALPLKESTTREIEQTVYLLCNYTFPDNANELQAKAEKAEQSWFYAWKWKYFYKKEKKEWQKLTESVGMTERDIATFGKELKQYQEAQTKWKNWATAWSAYHFPTEPNISLVKKWLKNVEMTTELEQHVQQLPTCWIQEQERNRKSKRYFTHLKKYLQEQVAQIEKTERLFKKWSKYFTKEQLQKIEKQPDYAEYLSQFLEEKFESLVAIDQIELGLGNTWKTLLKRLKEAENDWTAYATETSSTEHAAWQLLENSVQQAWIKHIENEYPILRMVDSPEISFQEEHLQHCIAKKYELAQAITQLKAQENTYKTVLFNRLGNRITYRDLLHQATKKKHKWSLRKMVQQHADELFQLLPCWLCSPETVSAVFPLDFEFDLVIFDEASQCYAEKGIPALYRGKQVIVAGDSKQLQPFNLYQVRWEEQPDQEDLSPDVEVDSLLDLTQRYLPQISLTVHYRSRSLALIDFSNRFFYNKKLQLIPERHEVEQPQPAIAFFKCEQGVWKNNRNEPEAELVTEKLLKNVKETPQKTFCVITFNSYQQQLILDKIEKYYEQHQAGVPHNIAVKNIENVQGDEYDVVIFSVGYAPTAAGKFNMQFGSLSTSGGENRLNVAVTRAKEKIMIVSSIEPHQLHVENTQNEGAKLLKAYLEYAKSVAQGEFIAALPEYSIKNEHHTQVMLWQKLQQQQPSWQRKYPFADLVHQNNQKLLLTDDEAYYAATSVKEIHAYLPTTLRQKKWQFERMFSRNWWKKK